MEATITFVTEEQFIIILCGLHLTDFAEHGLKVLFPLLLGDVGWFESEVPLTVGYPAETLGQGRVVGVKLVIKGQLFIFVDVSVGEYTDAHLSQHVPLHCDAIGFTRVVYEPSQISLISWVNNLLIIDLHQVCASRFGVLLSSAPTEGALSLEDLANILHDELSLVNLFSRRQTPSFSATPERIYARILVFLEATVLTLLSTRA